MRAVEQREALLRTERERREAGVGESDFRRQAATLEKDLADPDHRRGHVGQRREIARRADRPLHGDDGRHAARQHRLQERQRFPPHAGGALGQAPELQGHHQPDDRSGRRLADAGGMRKHDVALQPREVRLGDANAGEFAEAGIHAIDRLALAHDARDRRGARLDPRPAGGIEDRAGAAVDRAPIREGRRAGIEEDVGHRPFQTRACSGLKPSR